MDVHAAHGPNARRRARGADEPSDGPLLPPVTVGAAGQSRALDESGRALFHRTLSPSRPCGGPGTLGRAAPHTDMPSPPQAPSGALRRARTASCSNKAARPARASPELLQLQLQALARASAPKRPCACSCSCALRYPAVAHAPGFATGPQSCQRTARGAPCVWMPPALCRRSCAACMSGQ